MAPVPLKANAWLLLAAAFASIAERSILSPWLWLKSMITSRVVAPVGLSPVSR